MSHAIRMARSPCDAERSSDMPHSRSLIAEAQSPRTEGDGSVVVLDRHAVRLVPGWSPAGQLPDPERPLC